MNIKIKDCIMECSFNLKAFRKEFPKTLNFEDSVKRNLTIISSKGVSKKDIKRLIYLGFDWGGLFRQMNEIKGNTIIFKGFNVFLEGYMQYEPFAITNPKEFELKGKELTEAVMLVQDAIPNPNFCLNNLFYMTFFHFGHKKYGLKISMR